MPLVKNDNDNNSEQTDELWASLNKANIKVGWYHLKTMFSKIS